jgi:hypothetical protein
MSSVDTPEDPNRDAERETDNAPEGDSVASKLSRELSNWRRKRTSSRPRHMDGGGPSFQSEPARTIKVRGHETLVVRKPKLVGKSPANNQKPHNP